MARKNKNDECDLRKGGSAEGALSGGRRPPDMKPEGPSGAAGCSAQRSVRRRRTGPEENESPGGRSLFPRLKGECISPNACDPDWEVVCRGTLAASRRRFDLDTSSGVQPHAGRVAACPVRGTVYGSDVMAVPRGIEPRFAARQAAVLAVRRWNPETNRLLVGFNRRPGFKPVTHQSITWVRSDWETTGFKADHWSERERSCSSLKNKDV